MGSRQRQGFTLVEMLVVIAIIGILVALLLPAVQAARAVARRAQCSSRMSQIALGVLSFENLKQRFPGHQEWMARDVSGRLAGGNKPVSWTILLMPYIDQQPLYDLYEDGSVPYIRGAFTPASPNPQLLPYINFLVCPSRAASNRSGPQTTYMGNSGFFPVNMTTTGADHDPAPYDSAAAYLGTQRSANGVFIDLINMPKQRVRMADIYDGTSSTILISENLLDDNYYHAVGPVPTGTSLYCIPTSLSNPYYGRLSNTIVWLYAGDTAAVNAPRPVPVTTPIPPDMKINGGRLRNLPLGPATARPASNHSGGVNVAMVDKSTKFITANIDYHVYQSLMTRQNTKSDMPLYRYQLKDTDYR